MLINNYSVQQDNAKPMLEHCGNKINTNCYNACR